MTSTYKKREEKIDEIFEIDKDGKRKIVEKISTKNVEDKSPSKNQVEKENKILRNIFIGIGIIVLLIVGIVFMVMEIRHYNYHGVDFETVKEKNLILYKVSFPITSQNKTIPYNFYLRTNPKDLENVPFEANITTRKFMVINITNELNCGGYGGLGVQNLANLYTFLGVNTIKDENASCDYLGRYTYLNIIKGNETKIEQYGPSCYTIYVNNCEILPGTEKFMAETFVELQKLISKQKN